MRGRLPYLLLFENTILKIEYTVHVEKMIHAYMHGMVVPLKQRFSFPKPWLSPSSNCCSLDPFPFAQKGWLEAKMNQDTPIPRVRSVCVPVNECSRNFACATQGQVPPWMTATEQHYSGAACMMIESSITSISFHIIRGALYLPVVIICLRRRLRKFGSIASGPLCLLMAA